MGRRQNRRIMDAAADTGKRLVRHLCYQDFTLINFQALPPETKRADRHPSSFRSPYRAAPWKCRETAPRQKNAFIPRATAAETAANLLLERPSARCGSLI